jgi:hypothetical protein
MNNLNGTTHGFFFFNILFLFFLIFFYFFDPSHGLYICITLFERDPSRSGTRCRVWGWYKIWTGGVPFTFGATYKRAPFFYIFCLIFVDFFLIFWPSHGLYISITLSERDPSRSRTRCRVGEQYKIWTGGVPFSITSWCVRASLYMERDPSRSFWCWYIK